MLSFFVNFAVNFIETNSADNFAENSPEWTARRLDGAFEAARG